ncbi:hypothetical protein Pflav_045860 [Phytohabitans flavus]|uniref:Cyclic nucleotide-binding domain-containing protein n=1 Tax=Phytohabitans flavus TaxID=1076124 RepID=A0A6F8XWG5_9ACTN|nr:hypothetical protein Pflav_045860 [Phytohabitans flavus]
MENGPAPRGPVLDDEQFRRLADYGDVERAVAGRDLFTSGDHSYDFFLLQTASVDIVRDATAIEPERLIYEGGPGDFIGELNLLTGQHVYLTARVVTGGTVVRIGAAMLRRALAEQVDIADILIAAFRERREVIQAAAGNALELVGRPDAAETLALRTYVTQLLLPHTWLDAASESGRSLVGVAGLRDDELPAAMVNGSLLRRATPRAVAEALGLTYRGDGGTPISSWWGPARRVWPPPCTGRPKASTRCCWTAPGSAARRPRAPGSKTTSASRTGSAVNT